MRTQFIHTYETIISPENLLDAWKEFRNNKRSRKDVQKFERNLMANISQLHEELAVKIYKHSPYESFNISDPKPTRGCSIVYRTFRAREWKKITGRSKRCYCAGICIKNIMTIYFWWAL